MHAPSKTSAVRAALAAACLGLLAAGCWERPLREGTQMREFPEGFRYVDNVTSAYDPFPSLGRLPPRGYLYVIPYEDDVSEITMSEYPAAVTEAQVRAAFEARRIRVRYPQYGDLEPVRIGRRDGWGWSEQQTGRRGELSMLKYSVILPCDDRTFLLEYGTSVPKHMDLPAMQAQLGQFAYVRNGRLVK